MIELINFKRVKPDTSTREAMYRMTFECNRKGVDRLLEFAKLGQAIKTQEYMSSTIDAGLDCIVCDHAETHAVYDPNVTTILSQVIIMTNNKPLFLFIGKSASGKTTIANLLEERNDMKQVQSYTTRPPRFEGEVGHRFITDDECNELEDIVASTLYNGYWYCATLDQINEADIYVIDITGAKELLRNQDKIERDIHIIYFDVSVYERIKRMQKRCGTDAQIISRLLYDESFDWYDNISSIGIEMFNSKWWEYSNVHSICADEETEIVYKDTLSVINNIIERNNNR